MISGKFKQTLTVLCSLLLPMAFVITAYAEVEEAPTRDQIEDKYKWDLTDFFPSDEAWEEAFNQFKERIPEMEAYKGKLGSSAETLAECMLKSDTLGLLAHKLWVYAGLSLDSDTRQSQYQEMKNRILTAYSQMGQVTAYIEPEILEIPEETIQKFLNSNEQLAVYRFYLEDMFRRQEHVLSEEEERILALASTVTRGPRNVFNMFDEADIEFPNVKDEDGNEIELTRGRYSQLLKSKDREVRRAASNAYNETYLNYMNGFGANLASSIDADIFYTKARGYESSLARSLDANNIPLSVYHNLLETVSNNLEPLHKYVSLRKRALGVDTLFGFDMYVPLVEEAQTEYTYEEAKEIVLDALKPLGDEYLKSVEMVLNSRWIDVYETQGKSTGGYSWGTFLVHPVILLNYSDNLTDVMTLAHEIGHALHSYYTYQSEPPTYAGHSLFTAEVASTCDEAIVVDYLLKRAKTKEEKLFLLNHYIDEIMGTFYTQVFFSEFEHNMHQTVENGGALSQESLRKMYRDVYQKYYGPDYFIPEMRDLGCLRISHFYRMYYVYQYATGFAASQMLSKMILEGKPGAKEAYLEFVKTGASDYPIEILKKAGIDMTTSEPVENVIQIFSALVDEYEKVLFEE